MLGTDDPGILDSLQNINSQPSTINHQPTPPMQAIKALYKEGSIQLLEPLKDVQEAELFVIVLDKDETTGSVVNTFQASANNSEDDFKAIGLASFFGTQDDSNIDWEDMFDVKPR